MKSTVAFFALIIYSWAFFIVVRTIPVRENAQWTMLLCKFKNNSFIPHPKEWFDQWLTDEAHLGTIAYYFRHVSNGLYTISSSTVFGWFEIPYTKQELFEVATKDPRFAVQYEVIDSECHTRLFSLVQGADFLLIATDFFTEETDQPDGVRRLYLKTKEICSEYARNSLRVNLPIARRVITVVNDEDTAVFCKENGVLVAPRFMMTAAVSHEMVHSFYLGHSYSDVNIQVFPYARTGEYDDRYDLMSTANAYMFPAPPFGSAGPGLNGPHLDFLGWLPADRLYYFGRDGDPSPVRNLRLSSLSRAHHLTKDWLLIMLPYDRDDPQKVYTVELRTKENLDAGIPKSAVVIHQISRRGVEGFLYSRVLNQGGPGPDYELEAGAEWIVFLDHQFGYRYIRLRVDSINAPTATAQVTIHSSFTPTACKKSETQRSAFSTDSQCVTAEEKEITQIQNSQRKKTESRNGACLPSFVLRQAGPEDDVCVTLTERDVVKRQNQRWQQYKDFYLQPTFGLNSCKLGFVWRQIDAYDYVCVEASRKREIIRQNSQERLNRPTFLSECFKQFVFRKAFPGDDVCVSQEEQVIVATENYQKVERFLYPKFFNGEDKVE